mmetsp:Transcript_13045/g.40191  ORF Transcript_13045/g.40191 Transcript_13045/m.40191 type:complete len:82 (+) Transcript_13045:65-310(+)
MYSRRGTLEDAARSIVVTRIWRGRAASETLLVKDEVRNEVRRPKLSCHGGTGGQCGQIERRGTGGEPSQVLAVGSVTGRDQ